MEYRSNGRPDGAVAEVIPTAPILHCPNTPSLRHSSSGSGFTLIEVVIAFTIAALIIAAAATGLLAALRAEAMAGRQLQAGAALRTLQTGLWLGVATNNLATNLPPDWQLENEVVEQGEGTNHVAWSVWRLGPVTRASFSATLVTPASQDQPP